MNFTSLNYFLFLGVTALISWALPPKKRVVWLLIVSAFFYVVWDGSAILILALVIAITYGAGRLLQRRKDRGEVKSIGMKRIVSGALILCLGILFFYKYMPFALKMSGFSADGFAAKILQPLGISFFTFMALGYVMDVFRDKISAEENLARYGLFVAFFPLLLSGPIERAGHMLPQFKTGGSFSFENLKRGIFSVLWGLFLKMVIADRIALFVNRVYSEPHSAGGVILMLSAALFAIQVYCDFGGSSLIALGSARLLGFEVMQNFQTPFFAQSVREFWRRWHISLSSWFRDYLYIPLGGNRAGEARKYLNVFIVFTISGLWHGANLTFLAWGALTGIALVAEEILERLWQGDKPPRMRANGGHRVFRRCLTFAFFALSMVFFRSSDLSQAFSVYRGMFSLNLWKITDGSLLRFGLDMADWFALIFALFLLFLIELKTLNHSFDSAILAQYRWIQYAVFLFLFTSILIFGIYGSACDPQSFIYARF